MSTMHENVGYKCNQEEFDPTKIDHVKFIR